MDHQSSWRYSTKLGPYINVFLKGNDSLHDANVQTLGGYISGEIKLGITLILLACGDAFDFAVSLYVLNSWVIDTIHW